MLINSGQHVNIAPKRICCRIRDYVPNISAEEEKALSHARFFGKNGDARRKKGAFKAPKKGQKAPCDIKGSHMFPKKSRLSPKKRVGAVIQGGISKNGRFLGGKMLPNGGRENRYTVVVPSRVSKKAHERNTLKRRVREILLKSEQKEAGFSGWDIVVMCRESALALSFSELKHEIQALLAAVKRNEAPRRHTY